MVFGVGILTDFFTILTELVSSLLTLITSVFSGVVGIFYSTPDGFTIYGVLLLVGFGLSLVMFAIKWLKGLIANR